MREELKETKKLGNKGFSLIELIIVIAIMAILIGIVGTQVVPYIEKSKQAKDQQVISSLLTSATVAFSTNVEKYDSTAAKKFNFDDAAVAGNELESVINDFHALANYDTLASLKASLTSKAAADITQITISRDANGKVTVSVTMKDDSKYKTVFGDISST